MLVSNWDYGEYPNYGVTMDVDAKPGFEYGSYRAGGATARWGSAINDGNWHHVLSWNAESESKVYISVDNGTPVSAATTAVLEVIENEFRLGMLGGISAYGGQLGEVAIWSRVLTADERTAFFNSGNGKTYADLTAAEKVGLVSYWNLDEVSGTRVDSHGSNDLTDNNTVGSILNTKAAQNGAAASFVPANSESLSKASVTLPADFTVSMWVKPASDNLTYGTMISLTTVWSTQVQVYAYLGGTTGVVQFGGSDQSGNLAPQTVSGFAVDEWNLLTITYDSGTKKFTGYKNLSAGAETPAGTTARWDTPATLYLGDQPQYGGRFGGKIDEVAIWSRVLTEGERTELYNSGKGKFDNFAVEGADPAPGVPAGLVASAIGSSYFDVDWDSVAGADGYYIWKDGVVVGDETGTTFYFDGLTGETDYDIQISAYNAFWQSEKSAVLTVTTPSSLLDGLVAYWPLDGGTA
jgi:hypothetical protein